MSSKDNTVELMARIDQMVEQLRAHIDELRTETANGRQLHTTREGKAHE